MQRNKNWQSLAGVVLLGVLAVGCKGTGQQAQKPALYSAEHTPEFGDRPNYATTHYVSGSAATINRLPETTAARPTTCPVTGARLGSMGAPVPVEVNGRTVYVCCAGCVEKLRQNPERYLDNSRSAVRPGAESNDDYSSGDRGHSSVGGSSYSGGGGGSCCH